MKKMILFIVLLFGVSLISVEACTLAPAPSGFNLSVKDCDYGDQQEYLFDILFEKDGYDGMYSDTIDLTNYTDAWGNRPNDNQHILTEALPYMSLDNDYISLIGYAFELEYFYHNGCYQMILRDGYTEDLNNTVYTYGDFKIIVLDMDYNILYTSEVYSSDVLPHPNKDTYFRFEYDSLLNEIKTIEEDMFIPNPADCEMFQGSSGWFYVILFGGIIVTICYFFSESAVLAIKKYRVLSVVTSFVFGLISLITLINFPLYDGSVLIIVMLLLTTFNFIKYLAIRFLEFDSYTFDDIRKYLLVNLLVTALYPMFLFIILNIIMD